jgi:hypothetical protein
MLRIPHCLDNRLRLWNYEQQYRKWNIKFQRTKSIRDKASETVFEHCNLIFLSSRLFSPYYSSFLPSVFSFLSSVFYFCLNLDHFIFKNPVFPHDISRLRSHIPRILGTVQIAQQYFQGKIFNAEFKCELQAGRSRIRDQIRWINFLNLSNPFSRTSPWGSLSL